MTAPRTVSLFSDEPGWGGALVASLPRSLRRVNGSEGELALVDGRGDWSGIALVQIERGCRQVLLIDPGPAAADRIARLAGGVEVSGATCTLSEHFAGNPAIAAFRDWLGPDFGTFALESVDASGPGAAALAQLRLLRALGLAAVTFSHVARTAAALLAEGEALLGGRRLHIRLAAVGSAAGPARHRISAYAPAASARLELEHGGEALPATASQSTPEGVLTLPSIHESAHRRNLRGLLEGGAASGAEALRALAEDLTLAATLTPDERAGNRQ
jgi:hypothetical protein